MLDWFVRWIWRRIRELNCDAPAIDQTQAAVANELRVIAELCLLAGAPEATELFAGRGLRPEAVAHMLAAAFRSPPC